MLWRFRHNELIVLVMLKSFLKIDFTCRPLAGCREVLKADHKQLLRVARGDFSINL